MTPGTPLTPPPSGAAYGLTPVPVPVPVPGPAPVRPSPPAYDRSAPATGHEGARRFAALGDSLTAGVGDPVGGGLRGWAALLAEGLTQPDGTAVRFRNLAVSGARARDVAERQLPEALAYRPDVASVVVGVNDTLRSAFDITEVALALDRVCGRLAAQGAVLLTACLPDPGAMLGLPPPLARPLARRQRQVNAVAHALTARHGAVHLHLADSAWVADRAQWSADRLHPGERGHRTIAARFHTLLADRGLAHGAAPAREPGQPPPTAADTALWLATAGTGWLLRRCHDLLPQLLRLAGAETVHWARGTGARLDLHAETALAAALAAVTGPPHGPVRVSPPAPVRVPMPPGAPPAPVHVPAPPPVPVPVQRSGPGVPVPGEPPLARMGE
ncbi:SGNH/GDSL hydrolase family protein [Streptomyces sp. NPDC015131]|uniref:SGNH/GDSL hydrolase family protein n=1 Tax=Streptomyces sp. NPDC015131 TaxID=3364941 RepID=UPI0036FA9446